MNIQKFTELNCIKKPCNKDFSSTHFFKRTYYICNECSNQFAVVKKETFLIKILKQITGSNIFSRTLFFSEETKKTPSLTYDKYADIIKNNQIKPWLSSLRHELREFKRNKIDFKNKKILILSGGPGILAKYLSKYSNVTITEFSEKSVNAMKDVLRLNAIKVDFNSKDDCNKLQGKFDIIISKNNINYCEDQKNFLYQVNEMLNKNGTLILSCDKPSFGYMLTWMFHDNMPNTFLTLENILLILGTKDRYEICGIERNKYNSIKYRVTRKFKSLIRFIVFFPITFFYTLKIFSPFNTFIRKSWSLDELVYLKKKSI